MAPQWNHFYVHWVASFETLKWCLFPKKNPLEGHSRKSKFSAKMLTFDRVEKQAAGYIFS